MPNGTISVNQTYGTGLPSRITIRKRRRHIANFRVTRMALTSQREAHKECPPFLVKILGASAPDLVFFVNQISVPAICDC